MSASIPSMSDFPLPFAAGELRPADPAYADELFALTMQNADRLAPWLPWVRATKTPADTRAFLTLAREQFTRVEQIHCVIFVDGRAAGVTGINRLNRSDLFCEFGYWIAGEFEGRGIMTHAVRAFTAYAFTRLGLNRCEIHCCDNNARSAAVARRAGYTHEATLKGAIRTHEPVMFRDRMVFRMLREECPPLPASSPADGRG